MFNDKSTLTIGPNSNLVIDDFVYNPGAGGGKFAASLTKGALRFVGGQISHTAGATINTPVASLGIRGGAAFVTHDSACEAKKAGTSAKGCTRIVCTGGVCSVSSRVDSRSVQLRVNQAIEVGSLGAVRFNVTSVTLNDVAKGGNGRCSRRQGSQQGRPGSRPVDHRPDHPGADSRASSSASAVGISVRGSVSVTRVCHESRRVA